MPRTLLALVGLLFGFWLPASALAGPYSALHVFGDSFTDNGNLAILSGGQFSPPGYLPGRMSDGPVFSERLAHKLGLDPLLPSLGGGTNHAIVGALVDNHPVLGAAGSLRGQVSAYLGGAGRADSDALYLVAIGINDIRGAVLAGDPAGAVEAVGQALGGLSDTLGRLVDAGARHVLVQNLPDLGLQPLWDEFPAGVAPFVSHLSNAFNAGLLQLLAGFQGIDLRVHDLHALLDAIVAAPGAYGFSNISDRCYQGDPFTGAVGTVCADPSSYLFWDRYHPSAAAHALLADEVYRALVPEPGVLALLALGALALRRRRGV